MNGWNENTGHTNHRELMAYVRKMSPAAARFAAADAAEAARLNPSGHKASYYTDLVLYCGMRLAGKL